MYTNGYSIQVTHRGFKDNKVSLLYTPKLGVVLTVKIGNNEEGLALALKVASRVISGFPFVSYHQALNTPKERLTVDILAELSAFYDSPLMAYMSPIVKDTLQEVLDNV